MTTKYLTPSKIEKIAEGILDGFPAALSNGSQGVDIYKLADDLDCEVVEVDFTPDTVIAQVQRNNDANAPHYTIQISRKDTPRRQKFSVAHEIAHIILHDDQKSSFIEKRQSLIDYKPAQLYKEIQANMLAAALLMPKKQMELLWKNTQSVDEISDILNVSREAVANRLSNLGLLINE